MSRRDEAVRDPAEYERPRVERVLTPADLQHEILYAGPASSSEDEVSP